MGSRGDGDRWTLPCGKHDGSKGEKFEGWALLFLDIMEGKGDDEASLAATMQGFDQTVGLAPGQDKPFRLCTCHWAVRAHVHPPTKNKLTSKKGQILMTTLRGAVAGPAAQTYR